MVDYPDDEEHNHHYVVLTVDEDRMGLGRDQLVEILHSENVLARRYFHPGIHRMPPYAHLGAPELPVTEQLCDTVLVLPQGGGVRAA